MKNVVIRPAQAQRDAEAILEIYRPYILSTPVTFEVEVPTLAEFTQRVDGIAGAFPYLLLEIDGELVGYAYAHRQAERAAFGWNAELSIYLKESWRGKGVSTPLYALLMNLLTLQGYINFYGVITASNAVSIAMHEKMGFAKVGLHEKTGYKFGTWHDVVWMHRRAAEDKPGEICRFDALDPAAVRTRIIAAQAQIMMRIEG